MQLGFRALRGALVLGALCLAGISQVQAACTAPTAPSIPDGSTASEEQLIATVTAIKAYQADQNAYRTCLAEEEAALGDAITPDQKKASLESYNASVSAEEGLVTAWNEALRAYKARQN
jgi:tRNA threonylcarbamoyladenosine modification (KEOPS) complex Cgi121 subunit